MQLLPSLGFITFFDFVDGIILFFSLELQVAESRKGLHWTILNSISEIPSFLCIKLVFNRGAIMVFEEKCDKGYTSLRSISQVFVPDLVKLLNYSYRADVAPMYLNFSLHSVLREAGG